MKLGIWSFGISRAVQVCSLGSCYGGNQLCRAGKGKGSALGTEPHPSFSDRAGSGTKEPAILWYMAETWDSCVRAAVTFVSLCHLSRKHEWWVLQCSSVVQKSLKKIIPKQAAERECSENPCGQGGNWRCFISREGAGGSQWSPTVCQERENFLIDCQTWKPEEKRHQHVCQHR